MSADPRAGKDEKGEPSVHAGTSIGRQFTARSIIPPAEDPATTFGLEEPACSGRPPSRQLMDRTMTACGAFRTEATLICRSAMLT
jgi:hypothetical protein